MTGERPNKRVHRAPKKQQQQQQACCGNNWRRLCGHLMLAGADFRHQLSVGLFGRGRSNKLARLCVHLSVHLSTYLSVCSRSAVMFASWRPSRGHVRLYSGFARVARGSGVGGSQSGKLSTRLSPWARKIAYDATRRAAIELDSIWRFRLLELPAAAAAPH